MDNSKIDHTYFHSLEIEGIGCFKDKQILDLSNGKDSYVAWTLILGENGTGKTTLLKILDRFQPCLQEDFSTDSEHFYLPIDCLEHSDFSILGSNRSATLKIAFNNKIESVFIDSEGWQVFPEDSENIYLISYGATRRMSKINNLSVVFENEPSTLFNDSLELINVEEWYFQKFLNQKTSKASIAKIFVKQLEIIKKLLIDFLPDISDIRIKAISNVNETSSLEVKLENEEWIALRELSYGYQTMTALLVDIGSRMMDKYPESDNPLAEPVIILIDEIDLHLHPKWQRQIIEQFSKYFPKAQFIVTSHSPLIVQAAEAVNANIVVCRKDGDSVIIDNNPEEVKGWRIDQILISDLFNLPTIRSKADEAKMSRYYELMAKPKLNKSEDLELSELRFTLKKSFESEDPVSETERKINQFLETHLK